MRFSPGHASSTPPLKKYVTCAYFSVSAAWSCRSPALRDDLGERLGHVLLGEGDGAGDVVRGSGSSSSGRRRARAAAGELAAAVGPEVEEDRGVARRIEARPAAEHDRLDELVGDRRARSSPGSAATGSSASSPTPSRIAATARSRPLPAVVAIHRVVAADDGRDPVGRERRRGRSTDGVRRDVAAVGERVHPGPLAHPLAARRARAARAGGRCASGRRRCETSPSRCTSPPRARARRKTPTSAWFSKNEPSSIARVTRTRSWKRIRPEPIVRWPTSELPICPSGRPTAAPEAASCVRG